MRSCPHFFTVTTRQCTLNGSEWRTVKFQIGCRSGFGNARRIRRGGQALCLGLTEKCVSAAGTKGHKNDDPSAATPLNA